MKITGRVTTGKGEGKFYVPKYEAQLKNVLRFIPFPGTLNLEVTQFPALPKTRVIAIGHETLFPVDCYKITIQKIPAAIVVPHKTDHKNIVEIIAAQNLRETLNIHDGDELECELE